MPMTRPTPRGRARSTSAAILLAVAGTLLAGSLGEPARATVVDARHPRFFFYPDSLPAIRERALNGANNAIWVRYKNHVDTLADSPVNMHFFASIYLITGNTSYADRAIALAMTQVGNNATGYCYGEGTTFGRISHIVIVYDWCYDRLTTEQRTAIQDCMESSANINLSGYFQQYLDYSWPFKLAMVNDAAYSATAYTGLEKSIVYLRDKSIPCYDQLKPNGAQDGYYGKCYSQMITFAEVLKHTAGIDLISGSEAIQNSWRFWTAMYRPDGNFRANPSKYNGTGLSPLAYFAWQASRLGSRHAQAIVKQAVASGDYHPSVGLYLLAWYIPSLPADPISAGEKDWYDPYGWYLGRTGWDLSSNSTDVSLFFHMAPNMGGNRGGLHYDIIRGNDDLLVHSSYYEGDQDLHYSPWLTQTHSYNGILIYDPAMAMGTYTHDTQGSTATTRTIPNTGQQNDQDLQAAKNRWPLCTWTNANAGIQGTIEKTEFTSNYSLIEADATAGYGGNRASLVARRLTWYRPDWILVQDRIQLSRAGLTVSSLLHTVEKPDLDVTPTAVLGSWSQGGVFRTDVDEVLTFDHGSSSARVYVLAASAGGNPTAEIRLIGGPNRNGQHWRQNAISTDYGYVASADDLSYEFFVEQTGENYMPSDKSRVNDTDIPHRHDPPQIGGDWRAQITVTGGTGTVDIAYLVHVTARNAARATVEGSSDGGHLSYIAVANGDTLKISKCAPLEDCTDVYFESAAP